MSIVGQVLSTLLFIYWLILIGRLVFDFVAIFARQWRPKGVILLLAEGIYTVTDPPLRALRRIIPPLRIGQVSFDLAFLILLFGVQILRNLVILL